MSQTDIKHFKVLTLPNILQPNAIYYVKGVSDETVKTYVTDKNGVASEEGVQNFLELTDTPSTYAGQGNKIVSVKSDETGLEFKVITGGGEGASILAWTQEDADNGDYDTGTFVSHISKIWKSLQDNNTTEPSLSVPLIWEAQSVEDFIGAILTEDVVWNNPDLGKTLPFTSAIGTSFTQAWKQLVQKTFFPTLNAPTFSLTDNQANLIEIGSIVDVLLTFNFNRGTIVLQGVTQNPRAGAATSYTINGVTQIGNTLTVDDYTVIQGINNFTGTVTYGVGPTPLNSDGLAIDEEGDPLMPLAGGTSATQTANFEGIYPIFASSSVITTATKQTLVSMLTANNIQINLAAESGGNKQFFDIPDAWLALRPLVSIQYSNPVSGQFDTTNRLSDFTVTSVNQTIQGNTVGYKRRTFNGIDRGSVLIRLGF